MIRNSGTSTRSNSVSFSPGITDRDKRKTDLCERKGF
jgi:hypothetical protein